jgi:hypothetical protein
MGVADSGHGGGGSGDGTRDYALVGGQPLAAPHPGSGLYPIVPRKPPQRWVRWVFAVAGVAAAVVSLVVTPVPVSSSTLLADLRAGRVDEVVLRCRADESAAFTTGFPANTFDAQVCWSHGWWAYRTSALELEEQLAASASAPGADPVDVRASVAATAVDAERPQPRFVAPLPVGGEMGLTTLASSWLWLGLWLLAVLLLAGGPQPRRMTKWGVFWTLAFPLNAGVLWWLFAEAPWSARARALPEPASFRVRVMYDGRGRFGGGQMFGLLVLAALAYSVLAFGVGHGLGALLSVDTQDAWVVR